MKRIILIILALSYIPSIASAGHLQDSIKRVIAFRNYSAAAGVTNGLIGNSAGADDATVNNAYEASAMYIATTPTTAGTVSYIHVSVDHLYGTPKTVNGGIYSSTGDKIVDGTSVTGAGTAEVLHIQLDSPTELSDAVTYRLVISSGTNDQLGVDGTNGSYNPTYRDTSFVTADTLPATVSQDETLDASNGARIWATNTSDGS